MPDSRQRAPFPHQSSSADLSSHGMAAQRSAPTSLQPQWEVISPTENGGPSIARKSPNPIKTLWKQRKGSDEGIPGRGTYERMENGAGGEDSGNPYANGAPNGNFSLNTPPQAAHPQLHRSHSQSHTSTTSLHLPLPIPIPIPIPTVSTIRFVLLCFLWYFSSALSSNTGKVILNNFRYPVTLTIVQFFFVSSYCWIGSRRQLGWTGRLRQPSSAIVRNTLPMAVFQVGGHIFSSLAISRVPVSTVHTIKALSPLFTVAAYAFIFGVSYSPATYFSLLPLTLGVMLACSFDMSASNALGLVCAFGSTLVFVSSNIVFKKLMPSAGTIEATSGASQRLDKINLLYYSSGMAFVLMVPIWLYSDAWALVGLWFSPSVKTGGPSVPLYFFLNGTVHFAQNLLAFAILSSTSPVTYSIASLVKRIVVICLAIVWFKQSVHPVQAVGIALTALGLWMYNNAKRDVEKGEKKMRQAEALREGMLPTTKADQRILEGRTTPEPPYSEKHVHASPRPTYPAGYHAHSPIVSKSSAIQMTGFQLPPPAHPI
ncbi:solute carrier family 35, member E1, partial [Tremellales sp. Uapishka_1]